VKAYSHNCNEIFIISLFSIRSSHRFAKSFYVAAGFCDVWDAVCFLQIEIQDNLIILFLFNSVRCPELELVSKQENVFSFCTNELVQYNVIYI
jgi:hypothetical protein